MRSIRSSRALRAVLVSSCALGAVTAHANITFKDAPKPNELQAKYFDYQDQAGGLHCESKGKLKELVSAPYKCYLDLDECQASDDTITGKIDPAFIQLYADLVTTAPTGDKPQFIAGCPGDGPEFTELLGIKGLGYAQDDKHVSLLTDIVKGPRAQKSGRGLRDAVTDALWWMGDAAAAEPAYKELLDVETQDPEYKRIILQSLTRWHSKAGVEFCTKALTDEKSKKVLGACIRYLGFAQAKDTIPQLLRNLEKNEDETLHALGQMGDKSVVKDLLAFLDEKDGQPYHVRLPAVVALMNLGDSSHEDELFTYLKGQRPLSKKDKEKAAKAKKMPKKADDNVDVEFVQAAAMESLLLTNAKDWAKVEKVLKEIASKSDDKQWKAATYANIALAQKHDAKAVAAVAALLSSPKENIRNAVLDAVGGRDSATESNWMNRGFGLVVDKSMLPALQKDYEAESKKDIKSKIVQAMAGIRAALLITAPTK